MKSAFLRGFLSAIAVVAACAMTTPASAKTRHSAKPQQEPWHGWGNSFHYAGVRYAGGVRQGPKMSYNNWEGGFHPTAFWAIKETERT